MKWRHGLAVFLFIVAMMAFAFTVSAEGPTVILTDQVILVRGSAVVGFAHDQDLAKVTISDPIGQDSEAQMWVSLAGLIKGEIYEISFDHFVTAVGAEDMGAYSFVRSSSVELSVLPGGGAYADNYGYWQRISAAPNEWGTGWENSIPVTVTFTANNESVDLAFGVGAKWPVGAPHMVEAYFGDLQIAMLTPPTSAPVALVAPCEPTIVDTATVTETTLVTETVAIVETTEVVTDTLEVMINCDYPTLWSHYVALGGDPTCPCQWDTWLSAVRVLNPGLANADIVHGGESYTVPSLLVPVIPAVG
ncbi:hypothetical protein KJ909_02700 [Patescibacteria group bacterium]|nr:hypothetical protein [Patescibacteria group bacterium]